MTGNYTQDLMTVLIWLLGVSGTALIVISLWVAKRVVGGLDDISKKLEDELLAIRELFHGIDKRVIRLEALASMVAARNHTGMDTDS